MLLPATTWTPRGRPSLFRPRGTWEEVWSDLRENININVDLSDGISQDVKYSCVGKVERFEEKVVVVRCRGGVRGVYEHSVITQEGVELQPESFPPADKPPVEFRLLQDKLLCQPQQEGGQGEV